MFDIHWPIAILVIPTLVINSRPQPSQWITRRRNMFWGYVLAILRKRGCLNTCRGFLSWEASRGASLELIKSPTDTPKSLADDHRGAWKIAENLIFGIKNIEIQNPSLPPSLNEGHKVVKGQFQATLLMVHATVVGDIIFKLPYPNTGEPQFDTDAFAVWILNSIDDGAIAIGKIKGVESDSWGCILRSVDAPGPPTGLQLSRKITYLGIKIKWDSKKTIWILTTFHWNYK